MAEETGGPAELFVKMLKQNRVKTLFSYNRPAKEMMEEIEKNKISFGVWKGMVDAFIQTRDELPVDFQARKILTAGEINHPDFVLSKYQDFTECGVKMYERRDLKRITFIAPGGKENAVFYYRVELPAMKFWEQYIDFDVAVNVAVAKVDVERSDVVVVNRFLEGQLELVKHVKGLGKKVVFDIDDLLTCLSPVNPLAVLYTNPRVQDELTEMISTVDMVTTTTETLKKEMSIFNSNVHILRNKIDLAAPIWNIPRPKKTATDPVVVTFIGGSTHLYDLMSVAGAIINSCSKPNVLFRLCGYSKGGRKLVVDKEGRIINEEQVKESVWDEIVRAFSPLGDNFQVVEAKPLTEYPQFFSDADIIIAPLEDNRFNNSKSELKVIEAGAYSLPIVCSDVEPYQILEHGVDGFLAGSSSKFGKYLNRLIGDANLRKEMGAALRKKIEASYDAVVQIDRREAYSSLFKK